MVKKIIHKGKEFYQCEECKLYYKTKEIAKRCEDFCREKKACNLEIIKYAVVLK